MANEYLAVFVTAVDMKEAGKIADAVLKNRLAACANVIEGMKSSYWWKGKIEKSSEVLIIMKTKLSLMKKLSSVVKKAHSYEVPEITALPIVDGSPEYLKWIDESVMEQ